MIVPGILFGFLLPLAIWLYLLLGRDRFWQLGPSAIRARATSPPHQPIGLR